MLREPQQKESSKKSSPKPDVKQPSLRDEDEDSSFTLGDQIGDQLSSFMNNDDEE